MMQADSPVAHKNYTVAFNIQKEIATSKLNYWQGCQGVPGSGCACSGLYFIGIRVIQTIYSSSQFLVARCQQFLVIVSSFSP